MPSETIQAQFMYHQFLHKLTVARNWIRQRPFSLLAILLVSALLLRALPYKNTTVGFDQVQILEEASKIRSGDFTLIGPRTGPAQMFTGPLIYYFTVPFLLIFGDLATIVIVPLVLSVITGLAIYALVIKYKGPTEALLSVSVWAFSPLLIRLDRVFWNPNLLILATALLYFPLLDNKKNRYTPLFLCIGSFLAYQAHFSGFLLIGLALGTIILTKKHFTLLLAVIFGLLASILPTILFDLRNNYLNTQGLIALLTNSERVSISALPHQILNTLRIPPELMGSLFLMGNSRELLIIIGVVIIACGLFFTQHNRQLRLSLSWVIITTILFSLYRGEKPEYYFLILIPAFLHLLWFLLPKIGSTAVTVFFVIVISYSTVISFGQYHSGGNFTVEVLQNIRQYLRDRSVKQIVYDVPLGDQFGVKYLLKDTPLTENGAIVHIAYPNEATFAGVVTFGNVGVWIDPRTENSTYVTTNHYILAAKSSITLLTNSSAPTIDQVDEYLLLEQNQVVGTLTVSPSDNQSSPFLAQCQKRVHATPYIWVNLSDSQFIFRNSRHCLLLDSATHSPESAGISIQ